MHAECWTTLPSSAAASAVSSNVAGISGPLEHWVTIEFLQSSFAE